MMKQQQNKLQVIITSGPEQLSRAVLGFAFAVSASISGVQVMIFLTLDGIVWAEENIPAAKQKVNGFSPIEEYTKILKDNGVILRFCSSCAENNCSLDKNKLNSHQHNSYVGLTEIAIQAASNTTNSIVF